MEYRFSYSSLYQQWFFHKYWLESGSGLTRCCPVPRALWPWGGITKSPCKWRRFNGVKKKQEQNSDKPARSPSRRAPRLCLILWQLVLVPSDGEQLAGAGTARAAKECPGILHMALCNLLPLGQTAQAVSVLGPVLLRGWGGRGVFWECAGKGWRQEELPLSVRLGRGAVVTEGEKQPLKWKEGNIAVQGENGAQRVQDYWWTENSPALITLWSLGINSHGMSWVWSAPRLSWAGKSKHQQQDSPCCYSVLC